MTRNRNSAPGAGARGPGKAAPYAPAVAQPPVGERIAEALRTACHPEPSLHTSVGAMGLGALVWMADVPVFVPDVVVPATTGSTRPSTTADVDRLLVELFHREGRSLVRLARLFVDDRNAAEDLVQEAFIRLARSAHRIQDESRAAAYLRSIVLNLARDHNRRGLVSLRHRLPLQRPRGRRTRTSSCCATTSAR